jgi:5'-nucleotidase (lipoprotein e(P4) family)
MRSSLKIIAVIALFAGCARVKTTPDKQPAHAPSSLVADGKLFAAIYQQRAAEYRALCYQAYNLARLRIDQLPAPGSRLPLAIITDIDETVLDNSPELVREVLEPSTSSNIWLDWTSRAIADTVPGALSFFKHAAAKNISVYYMSNRSQAEKAATIKNLQRYGFPNADEEHVLVKQDVSSKEARRQHVAATHNIVLLIGDNLADLSSHFDNKKSTEQRFANTDLLKAEFGNKFILLPNFGYGDWEKALYNYQSLTPTQKDSVIRSLVKGY